MFAGLRSCLVALCATSYACSEVESATFAPGAGVHAGARKAGGGSVQGGICADLDSVASSDAGGGVGLPIETAAQASRWPGWRSLAPLGVALAQQVFAGRPRLGTPPLPASLVKSTAATLSVFGVDAEATRRWAEGLWRPYRRIVLSRFDGMAATSVCLTPPESSAGPGGRVAYAQALRSAMQSPDPAARQAFYEGPFAAAAAQLAEEATCLQLWAHTAAYMHHVPGMVVPLAIRHQVGSDRAPVWADGSPIDYAARNVVRATYPGKSGTPLLSSRPISAFITWPENDGPGPAVLVFRGTQPGRGDLLAELADSGLAADVDRVGVGHQALEDHAVMVEGWVADAHRAGRGVVLLGHSLGATLATRLMARLSPAAQARTRLLAMAPAGVESEVAQRIVPGRDNVVNVFDRRDLVPTVGQRLAPGTCLEAGAEAEAGPEGIDAEALLEAHIVPFLASVRLGWTAQPTWVRVWSARDIPVDPLGVGEAVRRNLLADLFAAAGTASDAQVTSPLRCGQRHPCQQPLDKDAEGAPPPSPIPMAAEIHS